jgi:hypothetical protein
MLDRRLYQRENRIYFRLQKLSISEQAKTVELTVLVPVGQPVYFVKPPMYNVQGRRNTHPEVEPLILPKNAPNARSTR